MRDDDSALDVVSSELVQKEIATALCFYFHFNLPTSSCGIILITQIARLLLEERALLLHRAS